MSDPLAFDPEMPRFALPLLFAGQAQKEFFVNEALLRADLLLHCAVEGETNTPPVAPKSGQAWLVGDAPDGDFAGHAATIAGWSDAGWRFVAPRDGLRIFDAASRSFRVYADGWRHGVSPPAPSGGAVVDIEARAVLSALLLALAQAGVLATS